MPVHEETAFWADCDECDWGTEPYPSRDQAEFYLDRHIREVH